MSRRVLVIGIGMGDPAALTLRAVEAINRADVFVLLDKGEAAAELIAMREAILAAHRRAPWRTVTLASPARGQEGRDTSGGYRAGVEAWHGARAALLARAIAEEVPEGGTGALLVWGDPMLYDSTLRVLERAAGMGVPFEVEVVPGITAVQALCAAHRMPLNGIGENVEVTTGRRVAQATPAAPAFVVLLDDGAGLAALMARGWDGQVWWGAYLGTKDEMLLAGRLMEVGAEVLRRRAEARARKGWVMDVWLGRDAAGRPSHSA
ncbi:precorrin-6A synthase (deacetylating) [Ancylobacter defluvii]|uniref:Precorrin-6A synthase [deacetylating] n=1 Tax=Ancylobacter defluvii TaxID=1282440 RepID=A0A9W6K1N2_9HYPH|nr:precorrin-6A synthase (deacetylating) [Ancylobacter defluvii]MBS7588892.1 precorrin-6A synthase (deacetylating) [Ancylobacter defluvii]GLK86354.1 precorrin-6A synthase (deacetylating) [Ancylobacter defluvii]